MTTIIEGNDRFLILRRAPTRLAEVRPRTLPCGCRTRVVGLGERVRFETDSSRCQYVTQQEATCEES